MQNEVGTPENEIGFACHVAIKNSPSVGERGQPQKTVRVWRTR